MPKLGGLLLVICDLLRYLTRVSEALMADLIKSGKYRSHPDFLISLDLRQELIENDLVESVNVAFLVIVDQRQQVTRLLHISGLHVATLLDKLAVKDVKELIDVFSWHRLSHIRRGIVERLDFGQYTLNLCFEPLPSLLDLKL